MTGWVRRNWAWAPLLLAAAWLTVLAADFRETVQTVYASADFVSAPVIGELYDERDGSQVVLGNFPWYSTLWFERLTAGVPGHRQVWQLAPWLFSLLGVAAAAWATRRAAGGWAAMIVAVSLGCAGPALLTYQFGGSLHSPAYAHVCLLGAFLVLCAVRGGRVGGRATHVLLSVLLALFTAAGLASDELLLPAGLAPFVLAGVAMAWVLPAPAGRRVAVTSVAIAAASLVVSRILVSAMDRADVVSASFDVHFATWDRLVPNLRLLVHSVAYLFNGDFGGAKVTPRAVLQLLCAAAVVAAAVAVARRARPWVREALSARATDPRDVALRAHVAFWLLAGLLLAATFVLSSVPVDKFTARYVLSAAYAVPILAVVASRAPAWGRAAVVVGVSAVVLSGILGLARGDITDNPSRFPTGDVSGPLERLARAEGVEHGYAGYWTAAPLTWQTKAAVEVYPVKSCTGGATLCPYPFHRIASWYRARPGKPSLLVVDPLQPNAAAPRGPDPAFGRPRRVARVGYLTVYVYDFDIASRFGR